LQLELYSKPKDSDVFLIDHLKQLSKLKGKKHEKLAEFDSLNENELNYLFNIYNDLKQGIEPITYENIYFYQKAKGVRLQGFEQDVIMQLDKIHFNKINNIQQ